MINLSYATIKEQSRSIFSNRLVSRIAILGSGTALAQLANMAATPILAYIYDPEDFGKMAILMGIVVIIGSLSSLCYESAIIIPEDKLEARRIAAVSTICSLMAALTSAASFSILQYFGYISLIPYEFVFWFFLIGVSSLGIFNIGSNIRLRNDNVKSLSIANIIRTVSALIVQVALGLLGFTGLGLIIGRLLGQASATCYVLTGISLFKNDDGAFSRKSMKDTAHRYALFPLFRAPQSLLALATEQIPAFALGIFFGSGAAGLYWLAHRVLKLPCTILSEATAKIYYLECARRYRRRQAILPLTAKTVVSLAGAAFFPSIILFLYIPELFGILGIDWQPAGYYGRWLMVWIFFVFCCSPVMTGFTVVEKQNLLLQIDIVAMAGRAVIILISARINDDIAMVVCISFFESFKIVCTVTILLFLCRRADRNPRQVESECEDVSTSCG